MPIRTVLFVLIFATSATYSDSATAINLLQDQYDVACTPQAESKELSSLVLNAKDTELVWNSPSGRTEFTQTRFMDRAVLMKSDNQEERLLFQVLEDGSTVVIRGKGYLFQERQCEDTGASKTCSNPEVPRLFWSSERLEVKLAENNYQAPIMRYGYFPNNATYFLALTDNQTALMLIDFGANFEVLIGPMTRLNCKEVR